MAQISPSSILFNFTDLTDSAVARLRTSYMVMDSHLTTLPTCNSKVRRTYVMNPEANHNVSAS